MVRGLEVGEGRKKEAVEELLKEIGAAYLGRGGRMCGEGEGGRVVGVFLEHGRVKE